MSDSSNWRETFGQLFDKAVERYRGGHEKAVGLVDEQGHAFLESIGYTEQEFFDFVEDFAKGGEPTREQAIAIAAVRRDYFLQVQGGRRSLKIISMTDLPSKDAEIEGIGWLPRLIPKAEAKLRGEMPPDLMYGCGGDRKFFRTNGGDPAEFLRVVWRAAGDPVAVVDWVKAKKSSS
jgi:hypothetical protein